MIEWIGRLDRTSKEIIFFGMVWFAFGMSFLYWILSIGMAPVLWVLMIVGTAEGGVCATKNAVAALKTMWEEGNKL